MQPAEEGGGNRIAVQIDRLPCAPAGLQSGAALQGFAVGHHVVHHAALQQLAEEVGTGHRRPLNQRGDLRVRRRRARRQQRSGPRAQQRAGRAGKSAREPREGGLATGFKAIGPDVFKQALGIAAAGEIENQGGDVLGGQGAGGLDE